MNRWIWIGLVFSLAGCAKKPSAMAVCKKLEVGGVAAGCRESKPEGLGAAASERAEFDLPSVPGKGGSVYRFDKASAYTQTVDAFEKAAMLAGPHRYASEKTLTFVQINDGASLEVGKKARAVIDALPGDDPGPPVLAVAPSAPTPKAAAPASPPTVRAAEVCAKLVAAGVAKDCGKPEGGPLEKVTFGITSMPGKNGAVMRATDGGFPKYAAMISALPPTSALRPYVTSERAGVAVHLSPGAPASLVEKAKGVVDAL